MSTDVPASQPPSSVTVMIPCYNEEDCVEQAYRAVAPELSRYQDAEILFVDDGSQDRTLELVKALTEMDARVRYVSFTRNYGLEAAFTAGFKYASKEATVQLDADLQSPPAEMHKLLAALQQGYDIAFGVRASRKDIWHRRAGSAAQQWVADKLLAIRLPRGSSVFRAVRTSVAQKIAHCRLTSPYFIATVPLLGLRYVAVPTNHQLRVAGEPKWSLTKLVSHTMDLWIGYSVRPLALVHVTALVVSAAAVAVLLLYGAGVVSATAVSVVSLVAACGAFLGVGALTRYLIPRLTAQRELPRFLVREANLPLDPADDLYEHERPAEVPAARAERGSETVRRQPYGVPHQPPTTTRP